MSGNLRLKKMNLSKARNFFFAAGTLAWAFAGLDGALAKDLGVLAFSYAARVGGGLLAVSLALELARRFFERESLTNMFEAKKVTRGEISDARDFSARFLPEVPVLSQLQDIYEASRGCVWFVNRCALGFGKKKTNRVGFFSLIRLTPAAIQLFSKNNLNSFQMDRTHIAGPRNVAPGLYIGGVGAIGFRAKGWVVQYLRARIDQFFESGGAVVFTRPVTEDGLRLAKNLGFIPTISEQVGIGNIYRLDAK